MDETGISPETSPKGIIRYLVLKLGEIALNGAQHAYAPNGGTVRERPNSDISGIAAHPVPRAVTGDRNVEHGSILPNGQRGGK